MEHGSAGVREKEEGPLIVRMGINVSGEVQDVDKSVEDQMEGDDRSRSQ